MSPTNVRTPDRIFVLSIAINEYRSSEVSELRGCVRDVEQLAATLKKRFGIPEDNFCILKDGAATREGIITAFRTHFGQLRPGDLAVLHYSGHGSWEPTHTAFIEAGIEQVRGRHEAIVVHDYEKDGGTYNLADKELRLLISALQYDTAGQYRDIEFVGLLDCCFSGSMFRNHKKDALARRTDLGIKVPRPLTAYLDAYYSTQLTETGTLSLPPAQYILMTACSPREYALENSNGGLFTQGLCTILDTSGELPTYADIHFQLHQQIKITTNTQQHPFLEYHGAVEPYWRFLSHHALDFPDLPALAEVAGQWMVQVGALHGLDSATWQNRKVPIYDRRDFTQPVMYADLQAVNLEQSWLSPSEAPPSVTPDQSLVAGISGASLQLHYDRQQAWATAMEARWKEMGLSHLLVWAPTSAVMIKESPEGLGLYINGEFETGGKVPMSTATYDFLGRTLQRYLRWWRSRELKPPRESAAQPQDIAMKLSLVDNLGQSTTAIVYPSPDATENEQAVNSISLPFTKQHEYYTFRLDLVCHSFDPLYVYLIHLGDDYRIQQLNARFNDPFRYRKTLHYNSLDEGWGLAFTNDATELTDRLILLFSREMLVAPYLFRQPGLDDIRGRFVDAAMAKTRAGRDDTGIYTPNAMPDWSMKFIDIHLLRS